MLQRFTEQRLGFSLVASAHPTHQPGIQCAFQGTYDKGKLPTVKS